jgi:acyl-CoA reductase-like NAD-dependent aldehyde dehydrogenase
MELGGSAPGIIFEDADLDTAIPAVYSKRFSNCGQICDGLKRLIVHESLVDKVIAQLAARLKNVRVGDPTNDSSDIGPLVAKRQLELLQQQVEDALQKGAKAITGGKPLSNLKGAYFEPTLLTHISKEMRVWREEVFGPVLPIWTFKREEEAIRLANETEYGLGAFIFTQDQRACQQPFRWPQNVGQWAGARPIRLPRGHPNKNYFQRKIDKPAIFPTVC